VKKVAQNVTHFFGHFIFLKKSQLAQLAKNRTIWSPWSLENLATDKQRKKGFYNIDNWLNPWNDIPWMTWCNIWSKEISVWTLVFRQPTSTASTSISFQLGSFNR
jgi:hypothetical protein